MGVSPCYFPDSQRAHSFTGSHVPCMEHLLFHGRGSADRILCHLPCLTDRSWVAQRRLQPSRSLCGPLKFVMLSSPSSPCSEPDIFQKASGLYAQDPAITRHVGRAIETKSQPLKCAIMGIFTTINYCNEGLISYLSKTDWYTPFPQIILCLQPL